MAITDEQRDAIVGPVRDGLRNLVTGDPGLFQDRPGFIAGGGPTDPFSNAVRGLTQANCRIWAAANKDNYSPKVNQGNARLCEPYLNDIGELPPEGDVGAPFSGGQCPKAYRPTGTYRQSNPNAPDFGATRNWRIGGNITGPIVGIVPGGDPVGTAWAFVSASNGGLPFRTILDDATGVGVRGPNEALGPGILWSKSKPTITNVNVQVAPDNCGDREPELIPPGAGLPITQPPPNITVNIPGIGPTNVNIDLDEDGNPEFCFEELNICVSVDIGGDGDAPPAPPGTRPPGDQGQPEDSIDVGEGDAAEGEDPTRTLAGVLVQIISTPPRANKIFNQTEAYTKGAYFVYLGGDAGLELIDTAAITRPDQYYSAPIGCNRFRVVPNNGFTLRVTPYYLEN